MQFDCRTKKYLLNSFPVLALARPERPFKPWVSNCGGTLLPSTQIPLLTYRHMSSRIFNFSSGSSHARLPYSPKFSQKYPNLSIAWGSTMGQVCHTGGTWCLCGSAVQLWASSTSAPIKLLLVKLPWRGKGNILFSHKQPSDNRLLPYLFRIPVLFSSQRKAFPSPRQNHSNSPGLILVFAGDWFWKNRICPLCTVWFMAESLGGLKNIVASQSIKKKVVLFCFNFQVLSQLSKWSLTSSVKRWAHLDGLSFWPQWSPAKPSGSK